MMSIDEITVQELKQRLEAGEEFCLVDCREPHEYEVARIEGSQLIPLSVFAKRALQELKPEQAIVIHCHHGGRSLKACQFLMAQGYQNVTNVVGGIDQWSLEIDPTVPRY